MPGMTGVETARVVGRLFPSVPILIVTLDVRSTLLSFGNSVSSIHCLSTNLNPDSVRVSCEDIADGEGVSFTRRHRLPTPSDGHFLTNFRKLIGAGFPATIR